MVETVFANAGKELYLEALEDNILKKRKNPMDDPDIIAGVSKIRGSLMKKPPKKKGKCC